MESLKVFLGSEFGSIADFLIDVVIIIKYLIEECFSIADILSILSLIIILTNSFDLHVHLF